MTCESFVKLIPLYYYGELAPGDEDRLEQHLDECAACAQEAERQRVMAAALDRRQMEPSATLLAECRHDLMRSIYHQERPQPAASAPWTHFQQGFAALFPALGRWRMPLAAAALVALGFLSGRWTTSGSAGPLVTAGLAPENVISSVRSIQPVSGGEVQIVLDETRQRVVSGHLDDSNIQHWMLTAAHDETNPALRVESVDILKSHSDSTAIRNVLLNRVLEDPNPGVRLKALDGLKPFVNDPQVQSALAKVLLRDENPGVRIQAVDLLISHSSDQLVGVLQNVVRNENNSYVRNRCTKALQDMNASVGTF
jgi:HEAT repeats/Putative zinc-finger